MHAGESPGDLFRYERGADDRCMSVEARLDCFVLGKSEVKAFGGRCPSGVGEGGVCELADMNRRRWTNNGGFHTLRMLEESSSEVTSSTALGTLPPAMVMSPESLNSPSEYAALELWGYDEAYSTAQSLLSTCSMQQQQQQMTQPLPSMPLPMPPTTPKSENESMSSGQLWVTAWLRVPSALLLSSCLSEPCGHSFEG